MVVEGGRGVEREASSVKSSSSILGERVELLNLAPLSRVGWSAFDFFAASSLIPSHFSVTPNEASLVSHRRYLLSSLLLVD